MDVADGPEDLSPNWLSEVLHSAGHEFTVSAVEAERVGTGQMGTTYRLQLTYEGSPGPPTLVAKMASEDEAARALVAPGYAAEVGFYTELAPRLDVRTPRCWYGAITPNKTRFTLLLDDAAPALPGVQADGCTIDQAFAALRNLAGLHAPLWCDPGLRNFGFLMPSDDASGPMMSHVMLSATRVFIERYADELQDEDQRTLCDACGVVERWMSRPADPYALIHGDYRLDNLLFDPDSGDVTAVDWQTAAVGPPLRDVAYMLGTCLPTDDRRAHEEALVTGYHSALVDRGVSGYRSDRCWDDYRLGQLQGPMITTIGGVYASGGRTDKSDAMFLAMARRSCAAIRDLGSIELV